MVEILIAVLILAIISTLTAVNISRSVKFKNKIEQDLDDYAAIRDALVLITHDVNLAFHWVDVNAELLKQIRSSATPTPVPPNYYARDYVPTENLTSFQGDTESLYLTTLSHVRTVKNSQESDQAQIGYYLKDVKTLQGETTKALVRSESVVFDGELKKGGKEVVLLENVKSFKLRYLGGDDKEWAESWKSLETDDVTMKNKFPDAVEITIQTSHKGKQISLSTVASIHNTYNDLTANLEGTFGASATPSGSASPGTSPAPSVTPHAT